MFISQILAERLGRASVSQKMKQIWRINRCEEFWEARRRLLADAFNAALRTMLPGRRINAAAA